MKTIEDYKNYLREIEKRTTAIMPRYEFSKEKYLELFGQQERINTPLEEVLISRSQYQKLQDMGRKGLMGAMYETLNTPDIVIKEGDYGEKHLYIKSFRRTKSEGIKTVLVVVVKKGNMHYAISTHQKELNNLLNKAKKIEDIVYSTSLDRSTGGNGDVPLANNGDNHLT